MSKRENGATPRGTVLAASVAGQRWLENIMTAVQDAVDETGEAERSTMAIEAGAAGVDRRDIAGAVVGFVGNGMASRDPLNPLIDRRAGELAMVKELLAERPELGSALVREARAASEATGEAAAAAMAALAENRAVILTEARLRYLHQEAPRAIAAYRNDLARYLDAMERSSAATGEAPESEEPADEYAETVTYGWVDAASARRLGNPDHE